MGGGRPPPHDRRGLRPLRRLKEAFARHARATLATGGESGGAVSCGERTGTALASGQLKPEVLTAAGSGCYVVIDAETELTLSSRYGARLLVWADGPVRWLDGVARSDLYGF